MEENDAPVSGEDPNGTLLKVLGVTFGIAVTIGGMIGLGILRTPGLVAAQLHFGWLIILVWVVGAAYALFGTFAAAELGASIQKTGGWYVYALEAFGEYPAFVAGWMDWLGYPTGFAIASVTAAEYICILFPPATEDVRLLAVLILVVLTFINLLGVSVGCRVQEMMSFAKAIIFLGLIAACFLVARADTTVTQQLPESLGFTAMLGALVIALQSVIYTYDGWYAAIYFNEESRDAGATVPKSMVMGVLFVALIYILINAALLYVLPVSQLAASELPVADAADLAFGRNGKTLVTVIAVVSLLGIMNANMMAGPRILFAMARDGLFVRTASRVNRGGTPSGAMIITFAASLPLIFTGTLETLLAVSAFFFIILYAVGFIALIVLRRQRPDLPRPYKAWGYPWTTLVVLLGSVAFLAAAVVADTVNALYAATLILFSFPAYLLTKRLRHSHDPETG
jgi:basic amino acid/polyamine antiporter, APA family